MELRHLRYFIAVAEEGHVTRAAERLGMQQPPLSQQIRALERELEVELFKRKPRGVELTDAGTEFLERARSILDQVDRAFATTRRTARGEQGRVVVGFTSSTPFHPFMPRVIRSFREMSPLVSLVLEESGSGELVQGVRNEEIDAAFIRSPVADVVGLVVRPLLAEEMLVAVPAGHALSKGGSLNRAPPIPLSALANETFVLYKRPGGPGLYDTIISACRGAGFGPRVGQEAPRIISTLNLVAAGLGVSIVPASLSRLQMDGVVYRRGREAESAVDPCLSSRQELGDSGAIHRARSQKRGRDQTR
jgi:DNA-binding transcriptional LysR family regulator